MWKLLAGFAVFAALALFILSKGGDIDMSGEKHDVSAHAEEPAASSGRPLPPHRPLRTEFHRAPLSGA